MRPLLDAMTRSTGLRRSSGGFPFHRVLLAAHGRAAPSRRHCVRRRLRTGKLHVLLWRRAAYGCPSPLSLQTSFVYTYRLRDNTYISGHLRLPHAPRRGRGEPLTRRRLALAGCSTKSVAPARTMLTATRRSSSRPMTTTASPSCRRRISAISPYAPMPGRSTGTSTHPHSGGTSASISCSRACERSKIDAFAGQSLCKPGALFRNGFDDVDDIAPCSDSRTLAQHSTRDIA